jgi:hypothetical protein
MLKAFFLTGVLFALNLVAAEPAALLEKKPERPEVLLSWPLALVAGTTNVLHLRGLNLTNVISLHFNSTSSNSIVLQHLSTGRVDVLKDADPKKVGDSRIEATVLVAAEPGWGQDRTASNSVVAVMATAESAPHPLWILPAGAVIDEREPNGSWRDTPLTGSARFIRGTIEEPADVDVFRWRVQAGERWRVRTHAASRGSALDAVLTIWNSNGEIVTSNDDEGSGSRDALIEWRFKKNDIVAVAMQDAHDKGGVTHVYVLELTRLIP